MSSPLHETASAVLYRALDLPPGDRQQFIAQATAGNADLFDDVRTMLSRIEQLDQFLEDPLELPSEPAPPPPVLPTHGTMIGRWQVERELGRNGADLILLVRDAAAGVLATMRLAQSASRTGQTSARFERLRERLATLDHPAIPAPIDSGATADGRPYFVVGRGAGIGIDAYCARHGLDLAARAALFARFCHAVHYMHQHLIVHRDLKPADMLVDGGDADADPGAAAITLLDTGMIGDGWPLNAAYASPDQLEGQPLSVASDIYSLGAVLYSLLSGQQAHGREGALGGSRRRAVPAMSTAVRSALELGQGMAPDLATDPLLAPSAALAEALERHFDAVPSKALALAPADRYASAHALALDLQAQPAPVVDPQVAAHATPAIPPLAPASIADAPERSSEAGPAMPAAPRRSPAALAVAMLAAGLVAGAAGAVFALPALQQAGLLPAGLAPRSNVAAAAQGGANAGANSGANAAGATAAPKAVALDPAIDPAMAKELAVAPAAQRAAAALQASAWQAALSDARRAGGNLDGAVQAAGQAVALAALAAAPEREMAANGAQLRLGASLAARGNTDEGLAALRKVVAAHQAAGGMRDAALAADAQYAIAEALSGSGDDAGAEAALNQARALYAGALEQAQAQAGPGSTLVRDLQARLLATELARAAAQNAQKHGKDTVATLAGLHRLPFAEANPRLALLEAFVQPRGTPAQAYAAALPALAAIKAANSDAQDAAQVRETALAAATAGEIGLRAGQKATACTQLQEAQAQFDALQAAGRGSAYDRLPRERLARARAGCS